MLRSLLLAGCMFRRRSLVLHRGGRCAFRVLRILHYDKRRGYATSPCMLARLKHGGEGFPGGSVNKNLPADAGDMGSIPRLGRSHVPQSSRACALQLLSLCSRAGEFHLLSPRATTTEACAP